MSGYLLKYVSFSPTLVIDASREGAGAHTTCHNVKLTRTKHRKKRKKIQGMARRYFWLSPEGALSYSFVPNSPIRDSLFVGLSYVSASRKNRTFHIDSGKTVYHCKALTVRCRPAFRKE